MLQCVKVCCSVLQCVAVCRATKDQNAVHTQLCYTFGSLPAQAFSMVEQVCCSVLQCAAVCCSVLQCVLPMACC